MSSAEIELEQSFTKKAHLEPLSQILQSYLREMGIFTEGVDKILTQLETNQFFPKNSLNLLSDSGIFDVHFFRLIYITLHLDQSQIAEKEFKWLKFSPFTEKQLKALKKSKKWKKITKFFLNPFVAGTTFVFWLLLIFVGFIALSPVLPIPAVLSISFSASFISGLGLAYMGLFITGWNPDSSSRAANTAQNHVRAMITSYRYMSQRLLELYAHHETQNLAEDIAIVFNKNNRKRLKDKMLKWMDHSDVGELLRSLKEVHIFIREGSRNTALLNPDLTTHWLTLESNALINPPRNCDLNILFRPNSPSNSHDSSSPSNSFTDFEFEEQMS